METKRRVERVKRTKDRPRDEPIAVSLRSPLPPKSEELEGKVPNFADHVTSICYSERCNVGRPVIVAQVGSKLRHLDKAHGPKKPISKHHKRW